MTYPDFEVYIQRKLYSPIRQWGSHRIYKWRGTMMQMMVTLQLMVTSHDNDKRKYVLQDVVCPY